MSRTVLFLMLASLVAGPRQLLAQEDDGPVITILSPDSATISAFSSVKQHLLLWDKDKNMLTAKITFTEGDPNMGQVNDDTRLFHLPGVSLDETKGIFYAVSRKGDVIPVAQYKKELFYTTIVTTPNARIRILHPHGVVSIILQAISPDDPTLHPQPSDSDNSPPVANKDNVP